MNPIANRHKNALSYVLYFVKKSNDRMKKNERYREKERERKKENDYVRQ